ncbi:cora-domain-containing protein [Cutaneotrichosporon oleaginosum]|uniref:Cora-domain-containing protein n=1 Tax=Cutaneotrichosporon oleaginosum TaxID=879819 RepID=A0A0J1B6Q4_9TREE|nr:cora-domain-containing protein [Cutaneotrichosporon oleaginosum]KLT43389.1 cora-domain-containing protein [Cutaneotrichosporon oleaginosum]TXT05397.1 hypothetical protein COLE_06717 [Cutaneotrichosporon oleaginosum]
MTPPPSSPRQIQIDPNLPSAAHHRSMSSSASGSGNPSRSPQTLRPPPHRGSVAPSSIGTSYRDNIDVQRQMQQDIDSALSMSRARSSSVVERSPMLRGSRGGNYSSSPIEEAPFGMLSDAEEREMERAQHRRDHDGSDDEDHRQYRHDEHHSDAESSHTYQSRRRRRRSDTERQDSDGLRRVGSYATAEGIRSVFDFAAMEEFAATEREALDEIEGPATGVTAEEMGGSGIGAETRRRSEAVVRVASPARQQSGEVSGSGSSTRQEDDTGKGGFDDELMMLPKDEDESPQPRFGRRARKQSKQAHPVRRQAKLALFESFGAGEGEELQGGALKAPRPGVRPNPPPPPADPIPPKFMPYSDNAGHDRPYRFSFYSNALPVTIHARSLAELPAEGQTFEDLFKGRNIPGEEPRTSGEIPRNSGRNTPKEPSGLSLSAPRPQSWSQAAITKSMVMPGAAPTPPPPNPDDDPEAYTWWLDVLSPTDDEMRMLSRVFGIHPLTTEDILLEETREKIELFRNYYLVCFRSFDQDPYSQTYLEPLNMYIIVFREGTLSFHFRGTPHPQNVRRRIKHLKDYISVTSDWISYALIDDITDAFGPLIQSIEYEVDSIDELVLILKDAEQTDMLRRIGTCRKKVMGLLRLMGSKADVVKGLAKRCNENWLVAPKSDIGLYLSDIQDHLITMTSNLNHYEKILSRSHSNYLAQISIEMTDANNQINDVLSKLTALGTVLIPMNLVTGLWGMNVYVPGQDKGDENLSWFFGILGCLAAFAIVGAWATYKCFVRV